SGEAPADPEERRADHERRIDVFLRREVEARAVHRRRPANDEAQEHEGYGDRSAHHEYEARVPIAREVEEADDLARLGHAGDGQADGEEKARAGGDETFDDGCTRERTRRIHQENPPSRW